MLIFTARLVYLLRCKVKRTMISLSGVGEDFVEMWQKVLQDLCFTLNGIIEKWAQKDLSKILRKIHDCFSISNMHYKLFKKCCGKNQLKVLSSLVNLFWYLANNLWKSVCLEIYYSSLKSIFYASVAVWLFLFLEDCSWKPSLCKRDSLLW